MKVLEKKEYTPWTKQVRCPSCTSLLEVTESDVQSSGNLTYYTRCAVCRAKIRIPVSAIEGSVRARILDNFRSSFWNDIDEEFKQFKPGTFKYVQWTQNGNV